MKSRLRSKGNFVAEVMRSTQDDVVQLLREVSGQYVVLAAGETVVKTGVLSAAEILYEEEVDKRKSKSRSLLRRERADSDTRAVLSDSAAQRRLKARSKAGKGRGGV